MAQRSTVLYSAFGRPGARQRAKPGLETDGDDTGNGRAWYFGIYSGHRLLENAGIELIKRDVIRRIRFIDGIIALF